MTVFCGLPPPPPPLVFPLKALTCLDSSSSLSPAPPPPDSSGHLQSHPTLPITSSILLTVGAPDLNPPHRPHKPTLLSSVSGAAFIFIFLLHIFLGWGGCSKELWGFQKCLQKMRGDDADFQAVRSRFSRRLKSNLSVQLLLLSISVKDYHSYVAARTHTLATRHV